MISLTEIIMIWCMLMSVLCRGLSQSILCCYNRTPWLTANRYLLAHLFGGTKGQSQRGGIWDKLYFLKTNLLKVIIMHLNFFIYFALIFFSNNSSQMSPVSYFPTEENLESITKFQLKQKIYISHKDIAKGKLIKMWSLFYVGQLLLGRRFALDDG